MSTFKDILTCIAQGLTTFCYVWDTHILCAYLFFGKRITQYFSPAFIQGYDKFKALSLSLIKFMQIMIWCCSIHVVKIIINRHSHTHKYVDVDTDTHTHTHMSIITSEKFDQEVVFVIPTQQNKRMRITTK